MEESDKLPFSFRFFAVDQFLFKKTRKADM